MALLPSDPKQQKRLLYGVVPLLLLFAYWYFLHDGYVQELTTMEQRVERLQTMNSTARARATQSRQLEERLQQFERHIDRLEDLVPRSEEVSQLIYQVNQQAERFGVEVARVAPGQTDIGPHYHRRTTEMTVRGSFHNITRFLSEIGSLPRIMTPTALAMVPETGPARRGGQQLTASFVLETYVLPEPRSAPAQAGTGA